MNMLTEEELQEVVECVWMPALEMYVEPMESDAQETIQGLHCQLGIDGAWSGAVHLHCDIGLLEEAARHMFQMEQPADQDCRDVLAELTNMVGGTLKGLLPEPSDLQLPNVLSASCNPVPGPESCTTSLSCNGHSLKIWLEPSAIDAAA